MTIISAINATGWLQYQLAYLLLYPVFTCTMKDAQGNFVPIHEDSKAFKDFCLPDYFCENTDTIHWAIDKESPFTLENWMQKFDMVCSGKFVVSLFGMMFFTGFAVSSMVLPTLSDKFGRKRIF